MCLLADTVCAVRSPMAQAYLEYLVALHPALAGSFSRILSAGIAASKPGVPLSAGVEFMLRDYGISPNFSHTSRRLERRDVEKFEYVLAMSCSQRDTILSRWAPRSNLLKPESANAGELCREDLEDRVAVLGSFGGQGDREVSIAESINQVYWFHVGTKRIYPGYDKCFNEIKAFMADFVYKLTGFDVQSQAVSTTQEIDSRNVSHNVSEDEEFPDQFPSPAWSISEDRSGFEALRREISRCKSPHFYQFQSLPSTNENLPGESANLLFRTVPRKPGPQVTN
jgi:protein-tyrosine-phosphatase